MKSKRIIAVLLCALTVIGLIPQIRTIFPLM